MTWVATGCADCDRLIAGKCWRHQGLYDPPPVPSAPFFPAPTFVRTTQETCNHCWCERSVYKSDHSRCCKCHDEMHDRFVGVGASGESGSETE